MNRKTLAEHFKDNSKDIITLFYDQWKCPGSTDREQIRVGPMPINQIIEEYGDFQYEGSYTTGFVKDGFSINVWAFATEDKLYKYPQIKDNEQEFEKE